MAKVGVKIWPEFVAVMTRIIRNTTVPAFEQVSTLESTLRGTDQARKDWLFVTEKLMSKYNIPREEIEQLFKEVQENDRG